MTTNISLFTISFDISNRSLIDSLSVIQNEDWNGNNGEDYISDEAKREGFDSDLDYTLNYLHKKYDDKEFTGSVMECIIDNYLEGFTGGNYYYTNYEYNDIIVGDKIVVSVALVHEL